MPNTLSTTIREAVSGDVPLILEFIRGLAVYEREPDAVTATEADLLRDGFGVNPYFYCLIAEHDGRPADRKSTRLNSSHLARSRMPSSA